MRLMLTHNSDVTFYKGTGNEDQNALLKIGPKEKLGWEKVSIIIDLGASDSVTPPGRFPNINSSKKPL